MQNKNLNEVWALRREVVHLYRTFRSQEEGPNAVVRGGLSFGKALVG